VPFFVVWPSTYTGSVWPRTLPGLRVCGLESSLSVDFFPVPLDFFRVPLDDLLPLEGLMRMMDDLRLPLDPLLALAVESGAHIANCAVSPLPGFVRVGRSPEHWGW
jgi:hypothetical protein